MRTIKNIQRGSLPKNVFVQLQAVFRLEKRRETTPDVNVVPGSSKTFLQQQAHSLYEIALLLSTWIMNERCLILILTFTYPIATCLRPKGSGAPIHDERPLTGPVYLHYSTAERQKESALIRQRKPSSFSLRSISASVRTPDQPTLSFLPPKYQIDDSAPGGG